MTQRQRLAYHPDKGKPADYDLLIEIWRAAQSEPIGILVNTPVEDTQHWYTSLYKVRTWANDQSLWEFSIGYSRLEGGTLQIWRKSATKSPPNQPSGDIPLEGLRLTELDLPDDA
jgi:hypothetical protein